MKIVATSTHSKTSGKVVEDLFKLTMGDACSLNKIALDGTTYANSNGGTAISNFSYTIGTAAVSKKPLISTIQTLASCPITSKLFVFNSATNVWVEQTTPSYSWISSFTATSGQVTINQAAGVY